MNFLRRLFSALVYYDKTAKTYTPAAPSRRETWIKTCRKFATAKLVTDDTNLALVWAESDEELAELVPWSALLVGVANG